MFNRETVWLEDKLLCRLKLATDIVGSGIREFVNDVDGPEFSFLVFWSICIIRKHPDALSIAHLKCHSNLSYNSYSLLA
jgi:hypothetical protein